MTILYADDDADDLNFFTEMLKIVDPEATCLYAMNGVEALETLGTMETLPDFVFLDINMPVMDGRTCLREIKKDQRLKHLPVVIYTTSDDPKEKALCLELGASTYIFKPTSIETGIASLSNLLTK